MNPTTIWYNPATTIWYNRATIFKPAQFSIRHLEGMLAAVLFFVLVLLTPLQLEAKFKSLHCTNYDRSYGEILLCKIKAINRYRNSISIQFRQLRTVNNVHVSKTLDLGFPPKVNIFVSFIRCVWSFLNEPTDGVLFFTIYRLICAIFYQKETMWSWASDTSIWNLTSQWRTTLARLR